MHKLSILLLVVFLTHFSYAQKKQLSMEDAMLKARTTLGPENLKQLQFIKGSHDYAYLKSDNKKEYFVKGSATGNESVLLTLSTLNGYLRNMSMDTLTMMPSVQFSTEGFTTNIMASKYSFSLDGTGKLLLGRDILSKDDVEQGSAGYVAYVEDDNLFINKDGKNYQITKDGSADIEIGRAHV